MMKLYKNITKITKISLIIFMLLSIPLQIYVSKYDNYISNEYIVLKNNMDTKKCLNNYDKKICEKDYEPGKYFFTYEDIKKINNIKGVDEVIGLKVNRHTKNSDNSELKENKITTLNLKSLDIKNSIFLNINDNNLTYKFQTLDLPLKLLKRSGTYNDSYVNTNLIDQKDNNTNLESIVIPKHLANLKNISAGDQILLPVKVKDSSGVKSSTKEYYVYGIYEDKGLSKEKKRIIYVDYVNLEDYNFNSSIVYNRLKSIYGSLKEHKKYFENETDFENFAPYYDEINIFIQPNSNVLQQIEKMFPNNEILTNSSIKNKVFKNMFIYIFIFLFVILVLFILNLYVEKNSTQHINKLKDLLKLLITYVLILIFEYFLLLTFYNYEYVVNYKIILSLMFCIIIVYLPNIYFYYKFKNKNTK